MAGCFGSNREDRARERELDRYLDRDDREDDDQDNDDDTPVRRRGIFGPKELGRHE